MLLSSMPVVSGVSGQGSLRDVLSQLRQCQGPADVSDGLRQRLLKMAEKLARVRELGGEYARVELSEEVQALLAAQAGTA